MPASPIESAFERHRRELQLHCYRMLGSFEDAEDLVQETFLRAWRKRGSFTSGSSRAWLYRIATNACLDFLAARPRRSTGAALSNAAEVPWLQPYPDRLLPDTVVVAKETIELVFLVAIQHLPPRQRAALILRDVLGWSAKDVAALLEASVASANSALQRARATLKEHLSGQRADWTRPAEPSAEERALLQRFIDAHERADPAALEALLSEDARITMPPLPTWWDGRNAIVTAMVEGPFQPEFGPMRLVATRANGQPAAAAYVRRPGAAAYQPLGLNVLRMERGRVVETISFACRPLGPRFSEEIAVPDLFPAFGLPPALR